MPNKNDIYTVIQQVFESTFRPMIPLDTGNMQNNATKLEQIGPNTYRIRVDSGIAPYAVYTNEPWNSPKWNGKKNPNEKWFETAAERFANELAMALNGQIKTGE